jgi:outer membrane protein OmpA-like peptidoglycan-associated protein
MAGRISGDSLPDARNTANNNSTSADTLREGIATSTAPVTTDTSARKHGYRQGPVRLVAVFAFLAALLLVLLYAMDSGIRQRLSDGISALNLPALARQASKPLAVNEPPAAGISANRETGPADLAPGTSTSENIPATPSSHIKDSDAVTETETETETEETVQPAVKYATAESNTGAVVADAEQIGESTTLAEIEKELAAGGLQVEQLNSDSLKVSLRGDGVFEFNSARINDSAGSMLARLAGVLTARNNTRISVIGHTDSSGEPDYNVYLSQLRAKAVADYLIKHGLPEDRTHSEGRGDRETQFEESSRDRPELRRRVEIYISQLREE